MRLTNHPSITTVRRRSTIDLFEHDGETVRLDIVDLPATYAADLERELPQPSPPRRGWMRDGKRLLKDEAGRPMPDYDQDDPTYRQALAEHNTLALVFFVVNGVAPGQLEFEAERAPGDGPQHAYYRAVLEEMRPFFGMGDITRIAREVQELAEITEDDLRAARSDFSSAES